MIYKYHLEFLHRDMQDIFTGVPENMSIFHVTAEVSSLTRLTNDASRHQFLAQMLKAKVS